MRDVVSVVVGSFLLALTAQILIPLPFSPVPVTLQTFGVLMIGAVLGPKKGAFSVLLYIAEGAFGLPVFAGAGAGLARLLGPTGGYLVSFVGAAYLMGWLCERGWQKGFIRAFAASIFATAVIFVGGLLWLSMYVGPQKIWMLGLLPFLPGAVVKCLATASFLSGSQFLKKG